MTGKRFEINNIVKKSTVSFWDNKKQKVFNASHVLDELNRLNNENKQLKQQLECQQEAIVNAIDSLMELPSATLYLMKQWLEACEDFDSIEDMKNTFSERIKELKE